MYQNVILINENILKKHIIHLFFLCLIYTITYQKNVQENTLVFLIILILFQQSFLFIMYNFFDLNSSQLATKIQSKKFLLKKVNRIFKRKRIEWTKFLLVVKMSSKSQFLQTEIAIKFRIFNWTVIRHLFVQLFICFK